MYSQLLKRIAEPTKDYYNIILDHKLDIIARVSRYGQTQTATELGMSQTTLSNHLKLLNALADKEHRRYNLYYITFSNSCKIGISSDISNRLKAYPNADTIETWSMNETTAKEAEAIIKAKYRALSFGVIFPRANGGAVKIDTALHNDIGSAIDTPNEVFKGNILSNSDRAYFNNLIVKAD